MLNVVDVKILYINIKDLKMVDFIIINWLCIVGFFFEGLIYFKNV